MPDLDLMCIVFVREVSFSVGLALEGAAAGLGTKTGGANGVEPATSELERLLVPSTTVEDECMGGHKAGLAGTEFCLEVNDRYRVLFRS